ncbi:Alpha-(1-_3)-arabinofuranosyltransferase [Streptomyces sp. YIM 130001]|uniref:alpha-(1->3)-arabinofuranosyltransferase n=1 Tax=Streptomyces sp. YIM 130001 TaxID=2259644 RepID=UPI000E648EE8|nr:alpha-(1->3)-arabinofuranosyltransferase [Streptomyces sp. YIM 130001]RII17288.1 Alpha-(1->3)-arabinofuranosyltransferase [Streptomyces sp. YIM 130001]
MTSTVQSPQLPPRVPAPTTVPAADPPEGPRSRGWLLGVWALVFVLFVAASPGRQTFDTKLGVTSDPWRFLGDLGQLWSDQAGFGGITNQYVGYAFPMLPYYALTDLLQIPVWLAERLWMSLIVAAAFWGALRLAERFGIGNSRARLVGAAAFALWPAFTIVVGSTSAAALPGAVLPWVLLPLADPRLSARNAALRSALVIPFMGGVNAASTLASLLPVGLYLLSRPRGPRQRRLILWWVPGVLLATAWWVVPLLMLGLHGENFLPYVENAQTTTETMSATEALRGAGNWVAYLNMGEAWLPAGWAVAASWLAIAGSALAAALGLAGLARRDLPERRWLVLTVVSVVLVTLAGYGGAFGAPFHGVVQDLLDGALVPFRNIYKFQTGLGLALAFGLMHLVGVAAQARGARPVRGRRFAPLIAAVLVLPGLLLPYASGAILQPGSFQELPKYWKTTASWLKKNSPDSRSLVVPATAHGIYTWGSTIDQPLDVLAESRWAQRDYVPFGAPGNRRAMDAVEQALLTGGEVPGLQDYLSRAGLHYVVVRNDLDPDQMGYVPTATVKRTLESSGYERATGFGPKMTGGRIADDTPIQVEGLYPRQRAVEIYRPGDDTERPGQAGLKPVANTAVVSGGPESLLPLSADPAMRDRPTVLTGDNHPGLGKPPLQTVGDGLRRADTRFGLINSHTSYTYTKDERNHSGSVQNPGEKPHQILPNEGVGHQTTAVLRGAKSVTASSSGNWLFHLPQFDPVNAFDGNPDTAWAEGTASSPEGEWLRIGFSKRTYVPADFTVTPLPQSGVRAAPTRVKVETQAGSAVSTLQPNGQPQKIKARQGGSSWMKLTILDVQKPQPSASGAGFSEISIPDVQVTRMLSLPADAEGSEAGATQYSLHRAADPGGLSPVAAENGLHRRFDTEGSGDYQVSAQAIPVPGKELDELLYEVAPEQKQQIKITADSTAQLGAGLSPRNLTDGDLTSAWIAGDSAVLHLRWPDKKEISELVLPAAGGLSARPQKVEISSPDGAAVAGVDENGWARFEPITTDRLDITITESAPLTVHNPFADRKTQLPVGLTEVHVPALEEYRTPQPKKDATFELGCGQGPPLAVDGTLHATSAKGSVRDLTERKPIEVTLCAGEEEDGTVSLGSGTHRVEAGDQGPLALTDVSLTSGEAEAPATTEREMSVRDWAGDERSLTVGAGAASYLTMYENVNDGWKATVDGKELQTVRLDGWQQGWLVPADASGTIELTYEPATTYQVGLIGGAVALLLLIGLALIRRRETDPDTEAGVVPPVAPGPGFVLGAVVLTLVGVVVAGPFALLVPALAVLAWWRHALLVPIAFVAMAAAGAVAAVGAGQAVSEDSGAFSPVAQLLALIAVFAALVTVRDQQQENEPVASPGPAPYYGPVPPAGPAYGAPVGSAESRQGPPTTPLPRRERGANPGPAGPDSATPPLGTAGPTVSARGPGAAAPDPDPETTRLPFGKPKFRATRPPSDPPPGEDGNDSR